MGEVTESERHASALLVEKSALVNEVGIIIIVIMTIIMIIIIFF
jgi:hypothetical protein